MRKGNAIRFIKQPGEQADRVLLTKAKHKFLFYDISIDLII
jgi:hypothetical protein